MKSTDALALAILPDAPPTLPVAVANLASHVFTLAVTGDGAVSAIVRDAVAELGRLVGAMQEKSFGQSNAATIGRRGPLLQTDPALAALTLALGDNVKFIPAAATPVESLRRLLARL